MLPVPFYVTVESPSPAEHANTPSSEPIAITADTTLGTFIGSDTNKRALAVFAAIDDAQRFAKGRFIGTAIPIRTATNAIAFLREIENACGIHYLLVDEPAHSTSRKGAMLISAVIDWLWSTAGEN